MISENLRAKIRKLFDMAEMGTENEAAVAMIKARELMQLHGVTQDDVNLFITDVSAPLNKGKWLIMLAQLCGEFSGVVCFFSHRLISFAGDEIGANVSKELFIYLKNEIKRQLKKKNIKNAKLKNDFRIGCVFGIFEKMEKLGGWRDMQEKRKRIQEKHFSNIMVARNRKSGVDRSCFLTGKESGTDININRQAGVDARAGFLQGGDL
jgi:hypothetical protein